MIVPVHDLAGLGNTDGVFTHLVTERNCGIAVYETRTSTGGIGKMSLSIGKRNELKRWFNGDTKQPAWWSGWPEPRVK